MPIGSVLILLGLAVLAFAEGRSRADGRWRRLAVLLLAGLALVVVLRGGVDTRTLLGTPVLDILVLTAAVLVAVDLIGLPLPIARRLHLGLHDQEWEFDRRLYALTQEARRAVDDPRPGGGHLTRQLPTIIAQMSALRAPDEEWAAVRDGWVRAWDRYLTLLSQPLDPAAMEEALALQRELIERSELLRLRYRTNASRLLGKGS
jgi:hypothetical protein